MKKIKLKHVKKEIEKVIIQLTHFLKKLNKIP